MHEFNCMGDQDTSLVLKQTLKDFIKDFFAHVSI